MTVKQLTFVHDPTGATVRLHYEGGRVVIDEAPDSLRPALRRALDQPIYERDGALNDGALATMQVILQPGTLEHFEALAHSPHLVDLGLFVVEGAS